MNRNDIRKLVGGYATGTLTDAERKALFEAAMEDQTLFDAIADEGVLKEVLDDPRARAYLLEALPAKPTLVVAFPGGNGTEDMVDRAVAAGVSVIRVRQ